MNDDKWNHLEKVITELTPAEKRMLISRLERALAEAAPPTVEEIAAAQKLAHRRLLDKLARLPVPQDAEPFNVEDHDKVLYGEPA